MMGIISFEELHIESGDDDDDSPPYLPRSTTIIIIIIVEPFSVRSSAGNYYLIRMDIQICFTQPTTMYMFHHNNTHTLPPSSPSSSS